VFFAKLIKGAVSRQREFLADASAVRYTRNPGGIAGALMKIGALKKGARIIDVHAEEASHLFFGNGLAKPFIQMLATHPPIEERVRRIDPALIKAFQKRLKETLPSQPEPDIPGVIDLAQGISRWAEDGGRISVSPEGLVSGVGAPRSDHLAYAASVISDLPDLLLASAREPFGARALIYCLLLNRDEAVRNVQLEKLATQADSAVVAQTHMLRPIADTVGKGYRLPLLDMAIPTLKILSSPQYKGFKKNVKMLSEADQTINLFEYTLQRMIMRNLDPLFERTAPPKIKHHVLEQVQVACSIVFSCIAWYGRKDTTKAEEGFRNALAELGQERTQKILPRDKCSFAGLDNALDRIARASPKIKRLVLKACVACIRSDQWISIEEGELLRAIADSLDCPVPPLIPEALTHGGHKGAS
jgi:hypothetical protein